MFWSVLRTFDGQRHGREPGRRRDAAEADAELDLLLARVRALHDQRAVADLQAVEPFERFFRVGGELG